MQIKSTSEIIKSPLNFTGGKYKLLSQLLPLFPEDISTFIDIFCGGCNVGINVKAENIICNDIDSKLIGLFAFFKGKNYESLLPKIQNIIDEFNLTDSEKKGYSFYNCIFNIHFFEVEDACSKSRVYFWQTLEKICEILYLSCTTTCNYWD